MKVTLTAVYHNDKNKNGEPYKNAEGKPYSRCNIKTQEYGDKYLSGFTNKTTEDWKVGDVVEIEVEEKGEYLNFKTPKVEKGGGFTEEDRRMLREIHQYISAKKESVADEGLKPEDVPF